MTRLAVTTLVLQPQQTANYVSWGTTRGSAGYLAAVPGGAGTIMMIDGKRAGWAPAFELG